ncbi:MAG: hypothetical protein U0R71_01150 [Solirubrobacterales bacterium]
MALDPPVTPLAGDGLAILFEPLCEVASSIGVSVVIGEVPAGAGGYYRPKAKKIGLQPISTEISPNQLVKTLIHELAHALVRLDRRDDDPDLAYAEEEVVVECVVFWRDRSIRGFGAGRSVGDGCHRRRCRGARLARSASPMVARLRRAVGVAEGPREAGPDRGGDDDGCQEETDRGRARAASGS